ncbi:hypothetical protein SAY86_021947 [Trapa natans]|uniref:BIRD-IDD transcription factor second C2H2 zinc finger domain-containing protein n=1 Tax=Trapa natans TaxID=22666 RepID=A0AAN7MT80_TRANT|nr:hypothetical protein SAY86_021947 [Trapa natans]
MASWGGNRTLSYSYLARPLDLGTTRTSSYLWIWVRLLLGYTLDLGMVQVTGPFVVCKQQQPLPTFGFGDSCTRRGYDQHLPLRDQNPQLHQRGHNLPWKLKQRPEDVVEKRVYICPEKTCVHHDPSRALGDLKQYRYNPTR